jgi:hypothetical protein
VIFVLKGKGATCLSTGKEKTPVEKSFCADIDFNEELNFKERKSHEKSIDRL